MASPGEAGDRLISALEALPVGPIEGEDDDARAGKAPALILRLCMASQPSVGDARACAQRACGCTHRAGAAASSDTGRVLLPAHTRACVACAAWAVLQMIELLFLHGFVVSGGFFSKDRTPVIKTRTHTSACSPFGLSWRGRKSRRQCAAAWRLRKRWYPARVRACVRACVRTCVCVCVCVCVWRCQVCRLLWR